MIKHRISDGIRGGPFMKKTILIIAALFIMVSAALSGCGKESYFESAGSCDEVETTHDNASLDEAPDGDHPVEETADKSAPIEESAASRAVAPQEVVVKVYVYNDSDAKVVVEGADAEDRSGLLDINHATADELLTLDGIGATKAEAIISYREENGGFSSTEDIKNVSGIGDGTYEKIKDKITV